MSVPESLMSGIQETMTRQPGLGNPSDKETRLLIANGD